MNSAERQQANEHTAPNEAKDFLNRVRFLDIFINEKLEELHRLEELAVKITSTWKQDVVLTSGNKDKLGEAVAKIIDLQEEINKKVDEYIDQKNEADAVVQQIEDPDQTEVLYKKYFLYESLEQIAREMNYSRRNVDYIHGKALRNVEAILNGRKG